MKSFLNFITLIIVFISISNKWVYATPSTIIWVPSTDVQAFGTFHLGIDNYFTIFRKGIGEGGAAYPTDLGLTVGVSPLSAVKAEVGIDLFEPQTFPWVFNGKIGLPEGYFRDWFPALAFGGCYFGAKEKSNRHKHVICVDCKNISTSGTNFYGILQR